MGTLHRIDAESKLYWIANDSEGGNAGGYSCLGFDVAYTKACHVQKWLRETAREIEAAQSLHFSEWQRDWAAKYAPVPLFRSLIGEAAGYHQYMAVMDAAWFYCEKTGRRCPVELTPELSGLEGMRVEVTDRYNERRRFIVGKSTGWMPCHLEIKTRRSMGGGAVTGAPFSNVRVIERVR